ncbi:hypothetical protein NEOKW01_1473 [Nematocida sp. AWRm80]|nr:hypothetical protein NEOKW01_1473 [Nematocida sp. AWRm80]
MYHSLTIQPDNIYEQERVERSMVIKSVSLTPYVKENTKRVCLLAEIDGVKVTLCTLVVNSAESRVLDVMIKKDSHLKLMTEGENDIDVLFYEYEEEEYSEEDQVEYKEVKILPGEKIKITESTVMRIISASIKEENPKEKTVLYYSTEEGETAVARFIPGQDQAENIDMIFEPYQTVELSVQGSSPVTLFIVVEKNEGASEECSQCSMEECSNALSENNPEIINAAQEKEKESQSTENIQKPQKAEKAEKSEKAKRSASENTQTKRTQPAQENTSEKPCEESAHSNYSSADSILTDITADECQKSAETTPILSGPASPVSSTETQSTAEPETEVKLISEGIGKLIGKKTQFSSTYTIQTNGQTETFEETLVTKLLPVHKHLHIFSKIVKGTREGAILKATTKDSTGVSEYTLKIGKIVP